MFASQPGSFVTRDLTEALVTLRRRAGPTRQLVYISRRIYWIVRSNCLVGYLERAPGCGPLSGRRDILSKRSHRRLVPSSFCN